MVLKNLDGEPIIPPTVWQPGESRHLEGLHTIVDYAEKVVRRYFLGGQQPMNVVFFRRDADPVEAAVLMLLRGRDGVNPNVHVKDVMVSTDVVEKFRDKPGGMSSSAYSAMTPADRRAFGEMQRMRAEEAMDVERQRHEIVQDICLQSGVFGGDAPGNPVPLRLIEPGFVGTVVEYVGEALGRIDGRNHVSGRDVEILMAVGKPGSAKGIRREVLVETNLTFGDVNDAAIRSVEHLEEFPKDRPKVTLVKGRGGVLEVKAEPPTEEMTATWRWANQKLAEYINPQGTGDVIERLPEFRTHEQLRDYLIGTLNR